VVERRKSSKKEASSSKPPQKRKSKARDEEGSDKKKTRKKKDPNAPKRAMTPFMYFSMAERANMKSSNPDLVTTEIAKKLGEMWQKMSAEEKQPYIQKSQADKKRYEKETAVYRGAAPVDVDSGNESN
jgi:structure-specific recognition protein 1